MIAGSQWILQKFRASLSKIGWTKVYRKKLDGQRVSWLVVSKTTPAPIPPLPLDPYFWSQTAEVSDTLHDRHAAHLYAGGIDHGARRHVRCAPC